MKFDAKARKATVIVLAVLVVAALVLTVVMIVMGDSIFGDDFETTAGPNGDINVGGYENKFPTQKPADVDVKYRMDYLSEDLTKYIKLGEYKGLKVSANTYKITDELVESELALFLEEYADYEQITDRKTAEGDTIVVDYTGTLGGVAFAGGSANNTEIKLDKENNGYIPGFIDGMYGVMPGNTVEYNVTFPDSYPSSPDLAGKEVTFKVKVEYICGDNMIPELTDKFVSDNLIEYGCTNVEEFMLYFRGYLNDKRRSEIREQVSETLLEMIAENSEVISLPEKSVTARYWVNRQKYENYAHTYDMDYETFLSTQVGLTDADLRSDAEKYILEDLVIYSVIKAEGLQLTEDEYKKGLEEHAEANKTTPEAFEEYHTKEAVWEALQFNKMMDFVTENAEVEEIYASEAEDGE